MLLGEGHVGEDVVLGLVHEGGELRRLGPELVGDQAPLGARRPGVVLGEDGGDEGGDDAPALAAGMGEQVAHEVDAGAVEEPGFGLWRALDHAAAAATTPFRTAWSRQARSKPWTAIRASRSADRMERRAAASRLRLIAAAVR